MEKIYIICCLINITIAGVCALIRWCHMCKPYSDQEEYFYPARKEVSVCYLFAFFQIPFIIAPLNPNVWIYIISMGVVIYPLGFMIPLRRYFFLKNKKRSFLDTLCIAINALILATFITVIALNVDLSIYKDLTILVCGCIGIFELIITNNIIRKLRRSISELHHRDFSCDEDFPYRLAWHALLVPILWIVLAWAILISGSRELKAICDIIYSAIMLIILIDILSPNRKGSDSETQQPEDKDTPELLASESVGEKDLAVLDKIHQVLSKKQLYTSPHFKRDDLAEAIGCSHTYVSRIIKEHYGSFYNLINGYRILHAKKIANEFPAYKVEIIAQMSGFTSRQTFARAKSLISSTYLSKIEEEVATYKQKDI